MTTADASFGRFTGILLLALAINLGLYIVMESMISRERVRLVDALEANTIDFVRTSMDDQTRRKDRRRKPRPSLRK